MPFCESKCPYCAFGSSDDEFKKVSAYFKALCLDLNFQLKSQNVKEISTIFFGGGTPSAVNAKLYDEIFSILAPLCTPKTEITLEANEKKYLRFYAVAKHSGKGDRTRSGPPIEIEVLE